MYLHIYIFFLVGGGMEGVGGGRKHESTLYIHDGVLELIEMSYAGKRGVEFGIGTVILILVLGGM